MGQTNLTNLIPFRPRQPSDPPQLATLAPDLSPPLPVREYRHAEYVDQLQALADTTIALYRSPHTKRAYKRWLDGFIRWLAEDERRRLNRAGMQEYRQARAAEGQSESAAYQMLCAIRALAHEALGRGLITEGGLVGIKSITLKLPGRIRQGVWLNKDQLIRYLQLPNRDTAVGKRDAATLALLAGCGLRRTEATEVKWGQLVEREGRQVLIDIVGKGRKLRSVPVPRWAERDLEAWREWLGEIELKLIARDQVILRAGELRTAEELGEPMNAEQVRWVVEKYGKKLGGGCERLHAHDLRRTLAKLMRKAGVEIEQVALTLGHSSVKTTEMYLGGKLELEEGKAGVDRMGIAEGDLGNREGGLSKP